MERICACDIFDVVNVSHVWPFSSKAQYQVDVKRKTFLSKINWNKLPYYILFGLTIFNTMRPSSLSKWPHYLRRIREALVQKKRLKKQTLSAQIKPKITGFSNHSEMAFRHTQYEC